jgi:hypothetical protein
MGEIKTLKKFVNNKKGISSLFIGIYIALIVLLLISTLFIDLSVSHSSLTSYLQVEQDRNQESILISGPGGLNVNTTTGSVESMNVNNTGAIAVRIRALYIAGKFVCDPSTFPNDSYIAPKDSLWIQLSDLDPPITLNDTTLNGQWAVTTQRGTKSSDTGADLWLGPPNNPSNPNKLYFGPLLLIYDMFHWSSDGGSTWNNGWAIPHKTSGVIWRILVANIDNRQIILSSSSSFTLVQNSQQSNNVAVWNIDPALSNNLCLNSGQYYFLYYSLNGPSDLTNLYTPNPITSNFLTFIGNFVEQNGTLTNFGQTIPFEAVLITP